MTVRRAPSPGLGFIHTIFILYTIPRFGPRYARRFVGPQDAGHNRRPGDRSPVVDTQDGTRRTQPWLTSTIMASARCQAGGPKWRNWQTRWTQTPVRLTPRAGSTPAFGMRRPVSPRLEGPLPSSANAALSVP